MNRFKRWTTLSGTLAFLSMAGMAGAEEEKIPVKELPRAVLKAVKAKFPEAEIEEAAKEEEDGKTVFEVSLEVDDRTVDVSMTPDGAILEIEKEVSVRELPRAVKKALAARYPKAKIAKVEAITKGEHGPTRYEVVLATEVVVSPKGKFVDTDEDEEDEDDDKPAARSKKKAEEEDDEDKPRARSKKKAEEEDDEDKPKAKSKKKKAEKEDKEDDEDDKE